MAQISCYTSHSFKECLEDLAKRNNKSVSSIVEELLQSSFIRKERELVKLDVEEINDKMGIVQNTINALNNNVIQLTSRVDSHLKNTSSELERTVKNLIKEMEVIFDQIIATENKNFKFLDEQIYRLQVAVLETFRIHFSDDVKRNKAVKQLLMIIAERVEQFKSGKRTV